VLDAVLYSEGFRPRPIHVTRGHDLAAFNFSKSLGMRIRHAPCANDSKFDHKNIVIPRLAIGGPLILL
jgi:hypothetical protein